MERDRGREGVPRVPASIIGAPTNDSLTYATVEQQNLNFAVHSLRPWCVLIEQALSADRALFSENTYCEFKMDALLRADSATRAQVYTAALNPVTGHMTRAEVRRLEDLPPEDDPPPRPPVPFPAMNGTGVKVSS